MSDIAEYERRISYALERIGRGVELLAARPPAAPPQALSTDPAIEAAELTLLRDALAAERQANAQLSERVHAIREKQETTLATLERKLAQTARSLEAAQAEAARLQRANADLAAANRALLEAAGGVEPHLVNRALQAELEGLRAARAAELAELNDILGTLEPILGADPATEAARHG